MTLQVWLKKRPRVESDAIFLNHRGQAISVSGVQYRLKEYTQTAGVRLSCHRLRQRVASPKGDTFARRLAENGLLNDSASRTVPIPGGCSSARPMHS